MYKLSRKRALQILLRPIHRDVSNVPLTVQLSPVQKLKTNRRRAHSAREIIRPTTVDVKSTKRLARSVDDYLRDFSELSERDNKDKRAASRGTAVVYVLYKTNYQIFTTVWFDFLFFLWGGLLKTCTVTAFSFCFQQRQSRYDW